MWIPSRLYEVLPYVYAGAGLLTMYKLGNGVGIASGLMLMSAGGIVWLLRRNRRSHPRHGHRAVARPAAFDDLGPPPVGFMRLVWRKEYECGHPLIDAQHRRLFEAGNAILNAILEGESRADVELMLDELISHVEAHFCEEEALLARARQPLSAEHQRNHRQLLATTKALAESYRRGEMSVADLFTFLTRDVVSGHIVREDLGFPSGTE